MNENKISIKQYEQAADERVSLGGIKWEKKWDVCVQCDSREEADRVRAALAQPDVPETDFGKIKPVPIAKLRELVEIQGRNGTWNYDPYFHGMYNGMEVMLAVLEDREPVFRGAPKKWLSKKEWQGLTAKDLAEIPPSCYEGAIWADAKLKEKNT
jgi:hypothetical protein